MIIEGSTIFNNSLVPPERDYYSDKRSRASEAAMHRDSKDISRDAYQFKTMKG